MSSQPSNSAGRVLLFIALLLVATTLRAPITGVGPVLESIRSSFDLSSPLAGLLMTLPLIAFGLFSPFVGKLAGRFGFERTLAFALGVTVLGIGLRSAGSVWALFAGTTILGVGIALGNVLLPALVKREYPTRVPTVTGRCGIAIGLAAAAASAIAYPLSTVIGWQGALSATVVLPIAALAAVLLFAARSDATQQQSAPSIGSSSSPWTSPLAWQVTIFMAVNSVLFYSLITWLPSILRASGHTAAAAGSVHGFLQTASIVPGLLLGTLVARLRDQRGIAIALTVVQIIALQGFYHLPAYAPVWAFLFGMGSGGALLLSLMFIGMRTRNPQQAASLSGMAQCINFLAAAPGPMIAGLLHESVGNWGIVLNVGAVLALLMAAAGFLAGRNRTI